MQRDNIKSYIWILGVPLLILIGYIIWIYYIISTNCDIKKLVMSEEIFSAIKNNPGDFTWGTLGIILTFGSLLMMILTFRKQNDQFNEQFNMGYASRFESTFYNMMNNFYEVRRMTNTDLENKKENIDTIQIYAEKFIDGLKKDPKFSKNVETLKKHRSGDFDITNLAKEYGIKFSDFCSRFDYPLSYYFRFLNNMINFVIGYWKDDRKAQELYLNFIQAQLSDAELCLIFYNCLSAISKDSTYKYSFYDTIDEYGFLQNINPKWLADATHHKFYKKTLFRFLTREEQKEKLQKHY